MRTRGGMCGMHTCPHSRVPRQRPENHWLAAEQESKKGGEVILLEIPMSVTVVARE